MGHILLQTSVLILCGAGWRLLKPGGQPVEQIKSALIALVFYLLLPALVLSVLWATPLNSTSWKISLISTSCVLIAIAIGWFFTRTIKLEKKRAGALIIAAAFPNITYLGLPLLESTFGDWARAVAIQFDVFSCTPLILTVGVWIAHKHGREDHLDHSTAPPLWKVPAIWAAIVALYLNIDKVQVAGWLPGLLEMLSAGVTPLMLIALGMSLKWDSFRKKNALLMVPLLLLKLIIMPIIGTGFALALGLSGELMVACILETAMPSMVIGLVICEQFNLDTALYAMSVTISTLVSLVTLPLWYSLLTTYIS